MRLLDLVRLTEAEWLAQCPPASVAGADVERAMRKGKKALELLNSCIPDPVLVCQWSKDYEVAK